ncbi:YbaB/EbfC family nucleoid-associated protein [Lentzea sp. PSKA42]|uniref:YbaB/EbfC family nucleoid-associated protein n=1 Tax=Lentzea indica TaxID=2604800 RepID=A0ABX1FUW8_9PSEU|nr:YbaB/EbfC family nucleoid-associated protein [Lentzea indica]
MDPYAWVNDFEARAAELQRKSAEAQENLAAASGTASSKDGAVTVTVGPNGGLTNLQLGHRAVELGAPRLTALILETARQAQKNVSAQVVEAFRPIGEGTQMMKMITDVIEANEDEEPDETHALERIEEDDEPVAEAKPAPASVSAPAQPRPARSRRPADDEDDDENQPW